MKKTTNKSIQGIFIVGRGQDNEELCVKKYSCEKTRTQKKIDAIQASYNSLVVEPKDIPIIIYGKYLNGCFDSLENLNDLMESEPDFNIRHPHVFHWSVKAGNLDVLLKLRKLKCNIYNNHHEALLWALENISVFAFLVEKMNFSLKENHHQVFKDACLTEKKEILSYLINKEICTMEHVPENCKKEIKQAIVNMICAKKLDDMLIEKNQIYKSCKI